MDNNMLSTLNEYQMQAVIDESPACLVNAHVGSGKTTVLISKVFYLHKVKGIPFDEMVVLTFTNKAANQIKERITGIDPSVSEKDMLYFGTFHSVALRMLKTILPVSELGYTEDFAVIDPDEEIDMASRLIMSNELKIKYVNKLYKRLERVVQGQSTYANMKTEDDIQTLLTLLKEEKVKQNKMNFNDLIFNAITLLSTFTYKPHWIIIDEFQDSDDMQLKFIKMLVDAKTKIFAVGDPNQIIYSWRGSNHNVFSLFKNEYNANELSLPINYRSCSTILEVAKCFLSTNSDLSGLREQGSKIKIKNHYNPFNEAQYLCDKIKELVSQGTRYKDIAIFYRLQRQSKTLEDVFERDGIPFEVSLRKTLKDIPVLGWMVRLIRFSVNTNDTDSAIYVLTHNTFGEHLSSLEAKNVVKSKDTEKSALYSKMIAFVDWCKTSGSILNAYSHFNIDNYINPTAASFIEDRQHVVTLLENINAYITLRNVGIFEGIKDFIDSSALYGIDILKEDVHLDSDTVKLMTLHASKGLEFKHVYIIGANFGSIPLQTTSPDEQEEERRLFFVGVTRAKDYLEISYYTSPDDPRVMSGASSYISMIPVHLVERDELSGKESDLQAFRREVSKLKEQPISVEPAIAPDMNRKVKHPKYGIGVVTKENSDTITVIFDRYGEKEFIKGFSELEEV